MNEEPTWTPDEALAALSAIPKLPKDLVKKLAKKVKSYEQLIELPDAEFGLPFAVIDKVKRFAEARISDSAPLVIPPGADPNEAALLTYAFHRRSGASFETASEIADQLHPEASKAAMAEFVVQRSAGASLAKASAAAERVFKQLTG